jgi:asparagine synthase (glutamine-hydrolysing)
MCGIVGFLDTDKKNTLLASMLETLHHRGPDDKGTYYDTLQDSTLHLAQSRLSILDLSEQGHQPFISTCKNYVIIYNGEVYNFKEIQTELIALGYTFRSSSDTEVILLAYMEWGVDAVEKFIGMFAFCIYDKPQQKILLFRDRAGVKPLYYYQSGDFFLFASELKSFLKHPKFTKKINKEILPFYFQFGYIPAPYTIYEKCYKLHAGHYLEFNLITKIYQKIQYWDVTKFYAMKKFQKSEDEILADLETLLQDAFNLRMVSDVPVGVFLSGGYDSSLVTAILQKNSNKKLNTFTIGFEDKEFNEAEHAKSIAKYLGTNHTEYYCSQKDLLELIQDLPYYYDEPYADSSAIPTMLVSKLAKQNVSVALSADGGDEIFFGYSKYFALERLHNLNPLLYTLLKWSTYIIPERIIKISNQYLPYHLKQTNIIDKFIKFKRAIRASSPDQMFINASSYVEPKFLDKILKQGTFKCFDKLNFYNATSLQDTSFANRMQAVDYTTFMVDDILTKVDRATMSVSLEGREPLLDHRIVEYLARIPMKLKYKNNIGKYLSRKILYRYIPKTLIDKPKTGFAIPLKQWLETELNDLALKSLKSDILKKDDIFKREVLESLVDECLNKKVHEPTFIWMIIIYVMWREKWE